MTPKSFGIPRSSLPSCSPSPIRDSFFLVYFFASSPPPSPLLPRPLPHLSLSLSRRSCFFLSRTYGNRGCVEAKECKRLKRVSTAMTPNFFSHRRLFLARPCLFLPCRRRDSSLPRYVLHLARSRLCDATPGCVDGYSFTATSTLNPRDNSASSIYPEWSASAGCRRNPDFLPTSRARVGAPNRLTRSARWPSSFRFSSPRLSPAISLRRVGGRARRHTYDLYLPFLSRT